MTMKTKNRSLVQKVFTETCRGAPLELRYYRLWEEAPEGPTRYGAAIEAVCNGEATRAEVPDVTEPAGRNRPSSLEACARNGDAGEPAGGDRRLLVITRNLPGFGRKTGRHGRGCLL